MVIIVVRGYYKYSFNTNALFHMGQYQGLAVGWPIYVHRCLSEIGIYVEYIFMLHQIISKAYIRHRERAVLRFRVYL